MSEPSPVPPHCDDDGHDHDHAWRHVRGDVVYGTAMEYRCDICGLSWSL